MADKLESYTVICQGGLDTTQNHLFLDAQAPGAASELVNYEVGLYGGYKRIDGYSYFDSDFSEVDSAGAEGPILGIFIFNNIVIAARKQQAGTTYKFYNYQLGVGWVAYATGGTHVSTGVVKIRHKIVTFGNTNYLLLVDGVNNLTIFDGTSWYQADSTGAGGSGDPGGNQIINAPSYINLFENTVFLSGDTTYPALVVHSAPEDVFTWTTAAGGGQIPTGCIVNQIYPFRENLYVLGQQDIRKIYLDNTTFVIKDVTKNIGCIAPDSVIELNGDILFMAQDGIRTVSGTAKIGDVNLASISKQIQKLINTIQEEYDLTYLNSVVIKKKSQFRYFVNEMDSPEDALGVGIIGGLRGSQDSSMMEYSELQGIRVSCVVSGYLNGQEVILHGDYDGCIYKQEDGDTFNGGSVYSRYSTPFLTFGDFLTRKQLRKINVFTQFAGAFTLSAMSTFDWNNPDSLEPGTISSDIEGGGLAVYDSGDLYDGTAIYAEETGAYPILEYSTVGSFKSIRMTFTTSGDNSPQTIQGLVFEFTPQGKR